MRNYAVAVLVPTKTGWVCVRKGRGVKPPFFWRLPGGKEKTQDNGDWRRTAARELREETGIRMPPGSFTLIEAVRKRGEHVLYFCTPGPANNRRLRSLKDEGDEGEEVRIVPYEELDQPGVFFRPHRVVLVRNDRWPAAA